MESLKPARNGQLTVKGEWKLPFNILTTNCGDYVVYNWRGWIHNKLAFYIIKATKNNEFYIQKVIQLNGK